MKISWHHMRRVAEFVLDQDSIPPLFKACASLRNLRQGISIHASVVKKGYESYTSISNSIVSLYVKCNMLGSALGAFKCLTIKDSVSWNTVIHGLLDNGVSNVGLRYFVEGRCFGFQPNVSIFVLVLQACWKQEAYHQGMCIHGLILRGGYINNLPIQNSLLCMYARFHDVKYAEKLFEEMCEKDVISWSLLVSAYAQSGQAVSAMRLFKEMVSLGDSCILDGVMMVGVVQTYGLAADLRQARSIHCHVIRRGFMADVFVGNTLIDMYSKCTDIDSAHLSFDEILKKNVVTWNTMLTGLINNQQYSRALHLYTSMTSTTADMAVDEVTLVNLLRLSRSMEHLMWCRSIHSILIRKSIMSNLMASNTLLDGYAKCGRMDLSSKLFERMDEKNLVSWTTMVAGYTHCNMSRDAVTTFTHMLVSSQERPNTATILSLVEACSMSTTCLNQAKTAHNVALRNELSNDLEIGTALVDMYGKIGEVSTSRKIFDALTEKNVVSWTAMIGAYGTNGYAKEAVTLFHEMKSTANVKPNRVTMLSVLTACSHGRLVEDGLSCFRYMLEKQSLHPCEEHYSCMVDLLARAGDLESAMEVIQSTLNNNCGASAWGAWLSASRRNYACDEMVEQVASQLINLEPLSSSSYVLARNALALANNGGVCKEEQNKLRLAMKESGVKTVHGYSLVHVE